MTTDNDCDAMTVITVQQECVEQTGNTASDATAEPKTSKNTASHSVTEWHFPSQMASTDLTQRSN